MKNAVFIPLEILSQQELPLYVKHHESLDGRGLLRIFERKTPMERHDEPEKSVSPQAKEVLKKTEEN